MSIVVRKSPPVMVRPLEPLVTTGSISLSPHDTDVLGRPVTVFLVFEHPIHEPTETIKRGLSQALVHYYPISGRLGDDQAHIKCTGEGVPFVAASANCAVADAKFFDRAVVTKTLLDELAVCYPAEGCGRTDPLLLMQVTEFSCGGFVVGVTWNHGIADGVGMGQFLQAVGELARGLPSPSVVPVRFDDSVKAIPPSILSVRKVSSGLRPFDMAFHDVTVPSSLVSRIKDQFRLHSDGQPCTVFEAAAAVLWMCRTRAIVSDPEYPTALLWPVNARKHVGAKDGYYGNCLTEKLVVSTVGAVAQGDIVDVVNMIKRARDNLMDGGNDNLQHLGALHGYNLFIVSSWRNIGLDMAHFGGGTPARVMNYTKQRMSLPFCVLGLPYKGKDGCNVMSTCVKEEHSDAFLRELEMFTM